MMEACLYLTWRLITWADPQIFTGHWIHLDNVVTGTFLCVVNSNYTDIHYDAKHNIEVYHHSIKQVWDQREKKLICYYHRVAAHLTSKTVAICEAIPK